MNSPTATPPLTDKQKDKIVRAIINNRISKEQAIAYCTAKINEYSMIQAVAGRSIGERANELINEYKEFSVEIENLEAREPHDNY